MKTLAEVTLVAAVLLAGMVRFPADGAEALLAIPPTEQPCLPPAAMAERLAGLGYDREDGRSVYLTDTAEEPEWVQQEWRGPAWTVVVVTRDGLSCVAKAGWS